MDTPLSTIAVVDRTTLEVVRRIEIPFPEIYEILIVAPALAQAMQSQPERFQASDATEQLQQLERQVEILQTKIAGLKQASGPGQESAG